MSVMSTGRRPEAAVRRLSPERAYVLPRRPGRAGRKAIAAGGRGTAAGGQGTVADGRGTATGGRGTAAGGLGTARRRPGRPRLQLVPPLTAAGPAEGRPAPPPPGRTPVPAGSRVPAPRQPAGPSAAPGRVVRPAGAPAHRSLAHRGQARRRVRLTRRGRLVVWALAALLAAAVLTPVWLLAATGAQAANHGLPPAAAHAGLQQVVVRPGQTLWSIAMTAEPAADPRVVSQEIMQVNALSSQVLVPGESLWVPAR